MNAWWQPGGGGQLVSRAWAQVHVIALPRLAPGEVDAAIRYRVQAVLPSQDVGITTRSFEHRGARYGLAFVDRFPDPRPDTTGLRVGHPVVLPRSWPTDCLLAVRSPEGWEISLFQGGVLTTTYPPVSANGPLIDKIRTQHDVPLLVADPAGLGGEWPKNSAAAPWGPTREPWGTPWTAPRPSSWRWVLGLVLAVVGVVLVALSGLRTEGALQSEAARWQHWVASAQQRLSGVSASPVLAKDVQARLGFDFEAVLGSLAQAWPSGVVVTRLEVRGTHLSLTATSSSALAAVSRLTATPHLGGLKVTQIRPRGTQEEFDLDGEIVP